MKAKGTGIIDKLDSMRCSNDSYRRSFVIRYHEKYTDKKGVTIYANMHQNVECFNEVARRIKAEFADGDEVMFIGDLKSRETEYQTIHFIEIMNVEDITNISGKWSLTNDIQKR